MSVAKDRDGFDQMKESAGFVPARTREPVVSHVYRELRRAILQGKLEPQARLVETTLAEMLDVSRTPVREAISRLESDGLVSRLRGGGVVVGDTVAKLAESVVIRQCLEGAAARLACERASDEALEAIRSTCEAVTAKLPKASLKQRSVADSEFHMSIARASGSQRLEKLIGEFYEYSLNDVVLRVSEEEIVRLQEQHVAICKALGRRDGDAAEAAMRQHLGYVLEVFHTRSS